MTPPDISSSVRTSRRTAPSPEKFILNKPKPKESPMEIQIEAVVTALGHSFVFIYSDNVRAHSRRASNGRYVTDRECSATVQGDGWAFDY